MKAVLGRETRDGTQTQMAPMLVQLPPGRMVPPPSSRSPHATYGGNASPIRQCRLGQALPGKRRLRMRWRSLPQQPKQHPLDPLPTFPPSPHVRGTALNPVGNPSSPGSMHATHDGGVQAAEKRAKTGRRQEATSTQEVTSHVPLPLLQEAELRCVTPGILHIPKCISSLLDSSSS